MYLDTVLTSLVGPEFKELDTVKHPVEVERYLGKDLEQLAEDIGNLRYDALAEFLSALSYKLKRDSRADKKRGREKLAQGLDDMGYKLLLAKIDAEIIWDISKPHMNLDE